MNTEVFIVSLAWLSVIVPTALLAFALGLERLERRLLRSDAGAEPKRDNDRPWRTTSETTRRTAGVWLSAVELSD